MLGKVVGMWFPKLFFLSCWFLDDFAAAHPNWRSINSVEFGLKEILARWQDPKSADSIMKVQNELDETKQIVSETLEKILDRGQKLDDLVRYLISRINCSKSSSSRSNELSEQSKAFYKTAKKTNSWCCSIMWSASTFNFSSFFFFRFKVCSILFLFLTHFQQHINKIFPTFFQFVLFFYL